MSSSRSNRPHRKSKASRLCRRAPRRPGRCRAFSAPDFETLVDLSVADLFPEALSSSSRSGDQPEEIRPSWGLSTVFGAAIVAAGGYHLALRPFDRFRGRWIPAETEADRSGRRRFGGPTR